MRGSHPVRPDIRPGGIFPDYSLPDHLGTVRTLSELQGRDPLILTLARGNYCPKEHQQHLELAANYPKIAVAYTQIATIATDDHHTIQEFRASVGAQWPFLSDPGRTVQQDLDIAEYTDPEHNPMIPHTLVLKRPDHRVPSDSLSGRGQMADWDRHPGRLPHHAAPAQVRTARRRDARVVPAVPWLPGLERARAPRHRGGTIRTSRPAAGHPTRAG